ILCPLLHDSCKAGAYLKTPYGYKYNQVHPAGHARLSLKIIEKFITLTHLEEMIILFHMGMYGTHEFSDKGEYSLLELINAYNVHKVAKLFYFCDDLSAQFYEK
ncbi:MAG: hypothetical protein KAT91_04765, partial [Candidatus Aenigmarchaeota archaeon]|nr:hypothetical protein [Candidatus Aenigmarchaeota archaeon]